MPPKLTTVAACRVAHLDRQRFNEYVSTGDYPCAPRTVPGRSRLFDPDDMLALCLFKRLMDDGLSPGKAGQIACAISTQARIQPDAEMLHYRQAFIGSATVYEGGHPNSLAMEADGTTTYKVTTFNIAQLRKIIAHGIEEERSIIGPDDE
jgi:hypothetical protein